MWSLFSDSDEPPTTPTTTAQSSSSPSVETLRQQAAAKFKNEREQILAELRSLVDEEKYSEAQSKINVFAATNDPELLAMKKDVDAILGRINRKRETDELVARLKHISASNLQENYSAYARLVVLNPDVQRFIDKANLYKEKLMPSGRLRGLRNWSKRRSKKNVLRDLVKLLCKARGMVHTFR